MLFDTDVLIWYFRGNKKAQKAFYDVPDVSVSAISVMELFQGARSKKELMAINQWLHTNSIRVYLVNEEISLGAMDLLQAHTLAHGVELADALIAETTIYYGEEILTANVKHYRFMKQLSVKKFSP